MITKERTSLIYLTGFMGSGKSTIGPILANTIGYTYLDIDREIERKTGKQVREIFFDEGEPYFRSIERTILEEHATDERRVISLGGGTIANDANLTLIRNSGLLVYLQADLEDIFQRLKHKTDRPLLHAEDGSILRDNALRQKIIDTLRLREPYYAKADVTIETSTRRVGLTVDEVVRALSPFIQ